jgi:hypothetical protein
MRFRVGVSITFSCHRPGPVSTAIFLVFDLPIAYYFRGLEEISINAPFRSRGRQRAFAKRAKTCHLCRRFRKRHRGIDNEPDASSKFCERMWLAGASTKEEVAYEHRGQKKRMCANAQGGPPNEPRRRGARGRQGRLRILNLQTERVLFIRSSNSVRPFFILDA